MIFYISKLFVDIRGRGRFSNQVIQMLEFISVSLL